MHAVLDPLTALLARLRHLPHGAHAATATATPCPEAAPKAPYVTGSPLVAGAQERRRRQWAALTVELDEHARYSQWRSYRNTRLRMAHYLHQQGHLAQALELYLDVWYLDLNGPRDLHQGAHAAHGARLLTEDPLFEPERAAPSAGVRREVRRLAESLCLRAETVRTLFLHVATVSHRTCGLPLLPTQAWQRIGPELLR